MATRLVDALFLLISSRDQYALPLHDGVHHRELATPAHPSYALVSTNWDGQWYWTVAQHGYPGHLPEADGRVLQNPWAFYPLFPALARLLMLTGLPFGVAGPLVSTVCAAGAACVLFALVSAHANRFTAAVSTLALCLYPAAPVLQVAYTEGLALLLVAVAVWALDRRRYGVFVVACLLLGLTRPISAALALLAALLWLVRWARRRREPFERRERVHLGLATVAAGLSFLIWPVVTAVVVGRADAYFATQKAWLPHTRGFETWIYALLGQAPLPETLGLVVVVVVVLAVVLQPAARAWGTPGRLWVLAYGVYLLLTVRPATSSLRYALLMLVPFWPLPGLTAAHRPAWLRWSLVALLVVLGLASQWLWIDWFYVPGPDKHGYP